MKHCAMPDFPDDACFAIVFYKCIPMHCAYVWTNACCSILSNAELQNIAPDVCIYAL